MDEEAVERVRKRLSANPTILENAPLSFTVWFRSCKMSAIQHIAAYNVNNRQSRLLVKFTLFSFKHAMI